MNLPFDFYVLLFFILLLTVGVSLYVSKDVIEEKEHKTK
jgi:ABC-type Na+ efflux pump permease subunit